MNISIIYEDDDVLAVNKPAGIIVHPDNAHKEGALIQEIVKTRPKIVGVGDDELRPGVVHRLDRDTSGVLIIAKNQKSFEYLKSLFQNKEIIKKYIALVEGNVKNNKGVINMPIGRSKNDFRKRVAALNIEGKTKEAVTEYKVIERFSKHTLVEAFPKTGRTHQIRAHFKAIGRPIVCDALYGGKKAKCPLGLNRHFLHANFLEFTLPKGGKIKLEADMPEDLENVLRVLRKNQ
jgi:23S rRNA pseudouridine1911/1915/1917 synthase